jgi:hypothetical protein
VHLPLHERREHVHKLRKDLKPGEVSTEEAAIACQEPTAARLGMGSDEEIGDQSGSRATSVPVFAPERTGKIRAITIEWNRSLGQRPLWTPIWIRSSSLRPAAADASSGD